MNKLYILYLFLIQNKLRFHNSWNSSPKYFIKNSKDCERTFDGIRKLINVILTVMNISLLRYFHISSRIILKAGLQEIFIFYILKYFHTKTSHSSLYADI